MTSNCAHRIGYSLSASVPTVSVVKLHGADVKLPKHRIKMDRKRFCCKSVTSWVYVCDQPMIRAPLTCCAWLAKQDYNDRGSICNLLVSPRH